MTGRRWRLVELARLAGVTEQQVRNYVAAGLLPPAGRTASNYRVFTDQHADALRAVRTLADGHGWSRARAILGAVHGDDLPTALAVLDDSHAELARERARIAATIDTFTRAADRPVPAVRRAARIGQLAADIGVRTPVLRLWERRGLLEPDREHTTGYRLYGPAEQRAARLIAVLRTGGLPFTIIGPVIMALRTSGSTTSALAELRRREVQIQHLSRRRLEASAALNEYLTRYYPASRS